MDTSGKVKLQVVLEKMSVHIHSSEENNVMNLGWPHNTIQVRCTVYVIGKRGPLGNWLDECISLDIESEKDLAKVIKEKFSAASIKMPEGAFKTYQRMVQLANMNRHLYEEGQND